MNVAVLSPKPAPSTAFAVNNIGAGEARVELSKQWMARPADQRYLSLTALYDAVEARAAASSELIVDTRKVEFLAPEPKTKDDLNKLFLGLPNGDTVAPTHWSFGQLAGLAKAPAAYLRTLPTPITADAVNYGLRYNRSGETMKSYSAAGQIRALTGIDYGRIYDKEVVEAVMQIAGNGTGDSRWKVPGTLDWSTMIYDPEHPVTKDTTTLYASDRDVFMFLVDDRNPIEIGKTRDGKPDLIFRGFYVMNSEVGSGSLKVASFYLRAVCCNRIMWGCEGFEEITLRHTKYAPSRFLEQARPALNSYADGSVKRLIEGVEKAKAAKVADDKDDAIDFLMNREFSRKKALQILETCEREEGYAPRSAWDFAQGITAVARDEKNADTRVEMERTAGKILDKVA